MKAKKKKNSKHYSFISYLASFPINSFDLEMNIFARAQNDA